MAQESETILFEAVFDAKKAETNVLNFRKTLLGLKAERKDLDAAFKKGGIDTADYAKKTYELDKAIKAVSTGIREETKALEQQAKISQSAEGSIVAMRENLKLLNAQYIELSKADRGADFGVALKENARALSDELKALESQVGQDQRNVGNYPKAYNEAGKSVRDFVADVNIAGVRVGDVAEKFKTGGGNVLQFGKGILSAKGALTALTAVPIILVLSAIVGFLTKSKDGMELFGRKTAAVKAVLDLFVGKIVDLGRAIIGAFENPGKAIERFGNLIKENLTNRIGAFRVILDAIAKTDMKALLNGFLQLFTGVVDVTGKVEDLTAEMERAAAAGEAVARESQKIADAERKLNVERANSRAEIEKNKLAAEDVSKSQQARVAAAERAFAIENGLLSRQLSLQQRKIANIKAEMALSENTAQNYDELAEAETRLGELREESFGKQTELNNKIQALRIEGAKNAINAQLAVLEEGLRITQERGFQTLEIEKKILSQKLQLDLVGITKGGEQEKALRLKYKADLATLIFNDVVKQNERQNQLENDIYEQRLAQVRKGSAAELQLQKERINQLAFQAKAAAEIQIKDAIVKGEELKKIDAKRIADVKEINQQIKDVELRALDDLIAARLARTREGSQKEARVQIEIVRKRLADALKDERVGAEEFQKIQAEAFKQIGIISENASKKLADDIGNGLLQVTSGIGKVLESQTTRQLDQLQQQQDAQLASANLSSEQRAAIEEKFQKRREKLERDAAEKRRKIATIENLVNTALAVTKAAPNLLLMALAAASGIANQVVIASQKFADGTVLQGPSHAKGGIQLFSKQGHHYGEAEGDEMILTKGVYRNPVLRAQASALNVAGGGRALGNFPAYKPTYTPAPAYAFGGVLSGGSQVVNVPEIDYGKLARAMSMQPAPVVRVADVVDGVGRQVRVAERADA